MIKICIYNLKSKVNFRGELLDEFLVTSDLNQDDALSPVLFNVVLESVMRIVRNNQELTVIAYANNIVLIAKTDNDLKNTTNILSRKKIGLKINEERTKYMLISKQNHRIYSLKVNDYKFERASLQQQVLLWIDTIIYIKITI